MSDHLMQMVRAQQAQIDQQAERIRQLEALAVPEVKIDPAWGLNNRQTAVFRHLASRPLVTTDTLMLSIYSDRAENPPSDEVMKVFISQIRRKLKPFSVQIETVWGQGWRLVDRERFLPDRSAGTAE